MIYHNKVTKPQNPFSDSTFGNHAAEGEEPSELPFCRESGDGKCGDSEEGNSLSLDNESATEGNSLSLDKESATEGESLLELGSDGSRMPLAAKAAAVALGLGAAVVALRCLSSEFLGLQFMI